MKCTYCGSENITLVGEDEPWHVDYWICEDCQSTYNEGELDDGVPIQ